MLSLTHNAWWEVIYECQISDLFLDASEMLARIQGIKRVVLITFEWQQFLISWDSEVFILVLCWLFVCLGGVVILLLFVLFSRGDFQQHNKYSFCPFKYKLYTSIPNMTFSLCHRKEHIDRCFRLAQSLLQFSLRIKKYFLNSYISSKSHMYLNLVLLIYILCGYALYSYFLSPGNSLPEFSGMRLNFYLLS